jgi:hypothetical protein
VKRFSTLTLAVVALIAVGTATGVAYAASSGITSTTSDALIRTTSNNNLNAAAGVQTTIEALTLPAGKWVVHADNTMVNFGAADIARCTLFSGATSSMRTRRMLATVPACRRWRRLRRRARSS